MKEITISSGKTGKVKVTAIQDSEIEGNEFINIDIRNNKEIQNYELKISDIEMKISNALIEIKTNEEELDFINIESITYSHSIVPGGLLV